MSKPTPDLNPLYLPVPGFESPKTLLLPYAAFRQHMQRKVLAVLSHPEASQAYEAFLQAGAAAERERRRQQGQQQRK